MEKAPILRLLAASEEYLLHDSARQGGDVLWSVSEARAPEAHLA